MGLFELMPASKNTPTKETPAYEAPDVSQFSDRELLEKLYLAMDETRFTVLTLTASLNTSPMLKMLLK